MNRATVRRLQKPLREPCPTIVLIIRNHRLFGRRASRLYALFCESQTADMLGKIGKPCRQWIVCRTGVPQARVSIETRRGNQRAIGTELCTLHGSFVPQRFAEWLAACRVPKPRRAILTRRHDARVVRAERCGSHRIMVFERSCE